MLYHAQWCSLVKSPVVSNSMSLKVFSVGHSNHSIQCFLELLRRNAISAIADVRSVAISKYAPHFNGKDLAAELRRNEIEYSYLGAELGGRPSTPDLYTDGIADYEKMARTPNFRAGIDRVIKGSDRFRIALMCSERDPMDCHRFLLVARDLAERGVLVGHILPDEDVVSQVHMEERLLDWAGASESDLFDSRTKRLDSAYRKRSIKVAYEEMHPAEGPSVAAE